MPAILRPVPGILDEKVDSHLDALWFGLNDPRLELPSANAIQVVSTRPGEPALIVRDSFEYRPGLATVRPFAVGLPNGHNVLIDLDTLSLRRWWIGDFA